MKSDAIDPETGRTIDDVSPTTIFAAFASERRQHALGYLTIRPGAVPLGDVAEYVAIEEDAVTRDRYERVLTGLVHNHLPHLTEAGLVRYDPVRETVRLAVDADALRPYLDLVSRPAVE